MFVWTQVQSRVIWNSANSAIMGFAMSSDDYASLHDVYESLEVPEDIIHHPIFMERSVF